MTSEGCFIEKKLWYTLICTKPCLKSKSLISWVYSRSTVTYMLQLYNRLIFYWLKIIKLVITEQVFLVQAFPRMGVFSVFACSCLQMGKDNKQTLKIPSIFTYWQRYRKQYHFNCFRFPYIPFLFSSTFYLPSARRRRIILHLICVNENVTIRGEEFG